MFHKTEDAAMMEDGKKMITGRVVLQKKNVLDFNDLGASVLDRLHEVFGGNISFQLISAIHPEHESSGI